MAGFRLDASQQIGLGRLGRADLEQLGHGEAILGAGHGGLLRFQLEDRLQQGAGDRRRLAQRAGQGADLPHAEAGFGGGGADGDAGIDRLQQLGGARFLQAQPRFAEEAGQHFFFHLGEGAKRGRYDGPQVDRDEPCLGLLQARRGAAFGGEDGLDQRRADRLGDRQGHRLAPGIQTFGVHSEAGGRQVEARGYLGERGAPGQRVLDHLLPLEGKVGGAFLGDFPAQRCAYLIEGTGPAGGDALHAEDVPAEGALHRRADRAIGQGEDDLGQFGHRQDGAIDAAQIDQRAARRLGLGGERRRVRGLAPGIGERLGLGRVIDQHLHHAARLRRVELRAPGVIGGEQIGLAHLDLA